MDEYSASGRVWLRNALTSAELIRLRSTFSAKNSPGARLNDRELSTFVEEAAFGHKIRAMWPGMRPVRIVAFDKSPEANWGVPWHQDRTIAVAERHDLTGFSNWSRKAGIWHCTPPQSILERMLFVRVHLDSSTANNGAMEIALRSHTGGCLKESEIDDTLQRHEVEITEAQAGDVLVLAMLTLHRSMPARVADSRRVLRVDYAADPLPLPLRWSD
jgi:hypothetical protein